MTRVVVAQSAGQHGFFERSADRLPGTIAVDDHGTLVTYADLEARANRIAHALAGFGCGPNQRVIVFTAKHADQYAGLLGILKAGGCWVPFSNAFPAERRRALTVSLEPCAVIVDSGTRDAALAMRTASGLDFPVLLLDGEDDRAAQVHGAAALAAQPSTRPVCADATGDDLAYIIFTSGSTGTPKGVMVRHRNTAHFLERCPGLFDIPPGRRFAHFSDLTFDPSIFDLFHGWATGGTVVPFNRRKYRIDPGLFLREQAIDVLFCVPTAIATLAESGQIGRPEFASVRHLLLTGEPVPPTLVRKWYDAYPNAALFNMYGTTETAIVSHCYPIPADLDITQPIPVGYPIDGMRVRLMNGDEPSAPGTPGESVVSGPQLSPGYWDNAYQTTATFVADPADPRVPQIVYRTGDRLRSDATGLHHFVGRVDDQIKVRGHRVEPGEIEQALIRCALVRDAATVAVTPGGRATDMRLVAFVRLEAGGDAASVQREVAGHLPAYMVPSATLPVLQDFPRNANGKIDRAALTRLALDYFDKENRYGT